MWTIKETWFLFVYKQKCYFSVRRNVLMMRWLQRRGSASRSSSHKQPITAFYLKVIPVIIYIYLQNCFTVWQTESFSTLSTTSTTSTASIASGAFRLLRMRRFYSKPSVELCVITSSFLPGHQTCYKPFANISLLRPFLKDVRLNVTRLPRLLLAWQANCHKLTSERPL